MLRTKVLRPEATLAETCRHRHQELTWQATPSSRSSATWPTTPSCGSPRAARPSPTFRVASTPRMLDKADERVEGRRDRLFLTLLRLAAVRRERRRVAHPRHAGHRAPGGSSSARTRPRKARSAPSYEIDVDEVGPALRNATAKVTKVARQWRRRRLRRWLRSGRRPVGLGAGRRPRWPASPAAAWGGGAPARPTTSPRSEPSSPHPLTSRTTTERETAPWPSLRCASRRRRAIRSRPRRSTYVDYKDTALLRKFISDRGKIRARRVTGVSVQQQREIAKAVKNAREMALLPYTSTAR